MAEIEVGLKENFNIAVRVAIWKKMKIVFSFSSSVVIPIFIALLGVHLFCGNIMTHIPVVRTIWALGITYSVVMAWMFSIIYLPLASLLIWGIIRNSEPIDNANDDIRYLYNAVFIWAGLIIVMLLNGLVKTGIVLFISWLIFFISSSMPQLRDKTRHGGKKIN